MRAFRAIALAAILAILAGCASTPAPQPSLPEAPRLARVATLSGDRIEPAVAFDAGDRGLVLALVGAGDRPLAWAWNGSGYAKLPSPEGPSDGDLASRGPDGSPVWVGLVGEHGRVPLQRLDGDAWTGAVDASHGSAIADRPFVAARGARVAATWHDGADMRVAVSTDGGRSFGTPVVAASPAAGILGGVALGPSLVAAIYESDPSGITVATSADEGATWTPHVVATGTSWAWPGVAADETGALYAEWSIAYDERLPTLPPRSYGGPVNPMPATRVVFSASLDGGATWSAPRVLTARGRAGFYPAIDAAGNGTVALAWYDVPARGGDGGGVVRVALSRDRGASFDLLDASGAAPVPLEIACATEVDCRDTGTLGESFDVAASASGAAAVAWTQGAPGEAELWAARLQGP